MDRFGYSSTVNLTCPNCGSPTDRSHRFCSTCGSEQRLEIICSACGTLIEDDFRFCFECGTALFDADAGRDGVPNDQTASREPTDREAASIAVAAAGLSGSPVRPRSRPMHSSLWRHQKSPPRPPTTRSSTFFARILNSWRNFVSRGERPSAIGQTKIRDRLSSISITQKTRSLIVEAQSQTSLWHFDEFENLPARTRLTIEVAAVAALSILALYLRIYDLATLPLGFELNESGLSIDALRVLNGEWIGAWSPVHGGQPTGFSYWTALWFAVGEPNIFWARFASVIPGVALIPVAYVLLRTQFPFHVAILAAAFLSVSMWFIIPSRMGVQMMLSVFLGLASMMMALMTCRTRRLAIGIGGGIVLGLSIYSFKAFLPYFIGIWGFVALAALFTSQLRNKATFSFLILSLAVAYPVLEVFAFTGFIESELGKGYYGDIDLWDISRYPPRVWELLLFVNNPIGTGTWDGTGGSPLLHTWVMRVFFWFGFGVAVLNINRRPYQLLLIGWLIAASTAIVVEGAEARRYLFAFFFILTIMAIGVNVFVHLFIRNSRRILDLKPSFSNPRKLGVAFGAALIFIFCAHVFLADRNEFNKWSVGPVRWFFEAELFDALKIVAETDERYRVVSFNSRTRISDERVGYLYPELETVEGASEHGGSGSAHPGMVDGNTAFILFGDYVKMIDDLENMFPGQTRVDRYSNELSAPNRNLLYIAYLVRDT